MAAGVLYLAGDPVLKTGSRAEAAAAPVYKVDGLVLNDELVVRGMDRDATGMFGTVRLWKGRRAPRQRQAGKPGKAGQY